MCEEEDMDSNFFAMFRPDKEVQFLNFVGWFTGT
jgi:hypothetical protein